MWARRELCPGSSWVRFSTKLTKTMRSVSKERGFQKFDTFDT